MRHRPPWTRCSAIKLAPISADDQGKMAGERPRYGLVVSALGAVMLAISVFLPWYGVSLTTHGIAFAQQVGNQVAAQLGSAMLQSYMSSLHANLSGLAGHEFLSLSAHQALKTLNVVLLIAGGLGCVIALFALAGSTSGEANRAPLALLGAIAAACVLYRMIVLPSPSGDMFALTLREGAWLSLLGAGAMAAGALWPAQKAGSSPRQADAQDAWSQLSGWTPET
jgi:hypothetical protein